MVRTGFFVISLLSLTACSTRDTSPEAVCGHAAEVATGDAAEASANMGIMAEAANGLAQIAIQAAAAVCPTVLTQMKGNDLDAYEVTANCVLDSPDLDSVQSCLPDLF
jgi:hypothetical protein